ncbi:MAG: hypothetical protein WBG02_13780 [Candidatus Acidiferrum sp.]
MSSAEHEAAMDRINAERDAEKNVPMTRSQGRIIIGLLIVLALPVLIAAIKYILL